MDNIYLLDRLASMISYFTNSLESDEKGKELGTIVLIDKGDIQTLQEAVEVIRSV